jgi:transposase
LFARTIPLASASGYGLHARRVANATFYTEGFSSFKATTELSPWKTEAHFASWLGVCPDNRISGDKVLARGTRHVLNRAATALRLGASTLLKSQTYLGAQYRRLRSKLGAPKAITAMAHRLARLVYRMLKYGQHYVDKGAEYYERRNRQQQIEFLRKKAARLGLQLAPAHP